MGFKQGQMHELESSEILSNSPEGLWESLKVGMKSLWKPVSKQSESEAGKFCAISLDWGVWIFFPWTCSSKFTLTWWLSLCKHWNKRIIIFLNSYCNGSEGNGSGFVSFIFIQYIFFSVFVFSLAFPLNSELSRGVFIFSMRSKYFLGFQARCYLDVLERKRTQRAKRRQKSLLSFLDIHNWIMGKWKLDMTSENVEFFHLCVWHPI